MSCDKLPNLFSVVSLSHLLLKNPNCLIFFNRNIYELFSLIKKKVVSIKNYNKQTT